MTFVPNTRYLLPRDSLRLGQTSNTQKPPQPKQYIDRKDLHQKHSNQPSTDTSDNNEPLDTISRRERVRQSLDLSLLQSQLLFLSIQRRESSGKQMAYDGDLDDEIESSPKKKPEKTKVEDPRNLRIETRFSKFNNQRRGFKDVKRGKGGRLDKRQLWEMSEKNKKRLLTKSSRVSTNQNNLHFLNNWFTHPHENLSMQTQYGNSNQNLQFSTTDFIDNYKDSVFCEEDLPVIEEPKYNHELSKSTILDFFGIETPTQTPVSTKKSRTTPKYS